MINLYDFCLILCLFTQWNIKQDLQCERYFFVHFALSLVFYSMLVTNISVASELSTNSVLVKHGQLQHINGNILPDSTFTGCKLILS